MNIAAEFSLYRIDVYIKIKKHLRPVPDWYCALEIRINSAFTLEIRIIITERLYFSSSDVFFFLFRHTTRLVQFCIDVACAYDLF